MIAWLQLILLKLDSSQGPTVSFQDKCGAMKWVSESASRHFHHKNHIDLHYFYIKDLVGKYVVEIVPMTTKEMKSDTLTRPLTGKKFHTLLREPV